MREVARSGDKSLYLDEEPGGGYVLTDRRSRQSVSVSYAEVLALLRGAYECEASRRLGKAYVKASEWPSHWASPGSAKSAGGDGR